jgi:glycosyltransferase involved in cell wall biosynthesis
MSVTQRPLRILLVTTSYPLASGSASGVFVARLAEHLGHEVEVTIIAPAGTEQVVTGCGTPVRVQPFRYAPRAWQILAQRPGGIPVALATHRWAYLLVPPFLLAMTWSVWRAARDSDLIHANWAVCGFVAGMVGFLRRLPVVTTLRGEDVTRAQRNRLDALLLAGCVRMSARVVAVSEAFEGWLHARFPSAGHKISLIENGVDGAFVRVGEQRTGHKGDSLHLVTVGSLIPRKAVDHIIRAIAQLAKRTRVQLTVVGNGPEGPALSRLATSIGIDNQVVFHGAAAPEEVADLLRTADAFVLASRSEGRPNVVLEAMAAGLPVLAADIDGVRELVQEGKTGMLYPVGDVTALSSKIQALLDDSTLRKRLGRAAHDLIMTRGLLWSRTSQRYTMMYRVLVQG